MTCQAHEAFSDGCPWCMVDEQRAYKDAAYNERNRLVALLAAFFPSSMERHVGEDWGEEWQWVCHIDLPTGSVSWHPHASELPLFDHVPREQGRVWDGHDNATKWERVSALIEFTVAARQAFGV